MKVARLCVEICWELTGKKNFRGRHKSGKCLCCHWINKIVRITDTLGERGFRLAREREWTKHITPGMNIYMEFGVQVIVCIIDYATMVKKEEVGRRREREEIGERNRCDKIHCFLRTLHNINLIWMCYVCSGYAEVSGERATRIFRNGFRLLGALRSLRCLHETITMNRRRRQRQQHDEWMKNMGKSWKSSMKGAGWFLFFLSFSEYHLSMQVSMAWNFISVCSYHNGQKIRWVCYYPTHTLMR